VRDTFDSENINGDLLADPSWLGVIGINWYEFAPLGIPNTRRQLDVDLFERTACGSKVLMSCIRQVREREKGRKRERRHSFVRGTCLFGNDNWMRVILYCVLYFVELLHSNANTKRIQRGFLSYASDFESHRFYLPWVFARELFSEWNKVHS